MDAIAFSAWARAWRRYIPLLSTTDVDSLLEELPRVGR